MVSHAATGLLAGACRVVARGAARGAGRGAATGTDRRLLAVAGLDGQISTSFVAEGGWFLANPRPTRLSMLAVTTSHAVADSQMPRYQHCGQTQPPRQRFSSTFELSGGEAVRLNEGLGVTDGGKARYGLNATDLAAARRRALKAAPTCNERQRP